MRATREAMWGIPGPVRCLLPALPSICQHGMQMRHCGHFIQIQCVACLSGHRQLAIHQPRQILKNENKKQRGSPQLNPHHGAIKKKVRSPGIWQGPPFWNKSRAGREWATGIVWWKWKVKLPPLFFLASRPQNKTKKKEKIKSFPTHFHQNLSMAKKQWCAKCGSSVLGS